MRRIKLRIVAAAFAGVLAVVFLVNIWITGGD